MCVCGWGVSGGVFVCVYVCVYLYVICINTYIYIYETDTYTEIPLARLMAKLNHFHHVKYEAKQQRPVIIDGHVC